MAFADTLPNGYRDLVAKRNKVHSEIQDIWTDLGDDEYLDHDCDCEYCDIEPPKITSSAEREQAEKEIDRLTDIRNDIEKSISSVEKYADWMNIKLPEIEKNKFLIWKFKKDEK